MKNNNAVFWAIFLIVVGSLLLLGNLGIVNVTWGLIWPVAVIAFGVWLIWGAVAAPRRRIDIQEASIPLGSAARAGIKIEHGAGLLHVSAGASPELLALGTFAGGLDYKASPQGDRLDVKMRIPHQDLAFWPWNWAGGLDWDVKFNDQVPIQLRVDAGASKSELDLTDLRVTDLQLHTGASATVVDLPAHAGLTTVKIEAGAASVEINVPGGVAARIHSSSGLAAIDVDTTRFPGSGSHYQSPDFDSAANKVEMKIEAGVGAVRVR